MYQSPITLDNPESTFENLGLVPPESSSFDIWPQQNYQADPATFSNHTSLDFTPHISQEIPFGSQYDDHDSHTDNNGLLPDVWNTELNFPSQLEEFPGHTNYSFHETNLPEVFSLSTPLPFDHPVVYLGSEAQTETSQASTSSWAVNNAYGYQLSTPLLFDHSVVHLGSEAQTETSQASTSSWAVNNAYVYQLSTPSYSVSPTTIYPSEMFSPYSFPTTCKRSSSSPNQPDLERHSSTPLSGIPKRQISPVRHARTFSHGPSGHTQCGDCDRSFTLRKDLERHKNSIHTEERWKCFIEGCKYSVEGFRRKDKLRQHLRLHERADHEQKRVHDTALSSYSEEMDSILSSDTQAAGYSLTNFDGAQVSGLNHREQTLGTQINLDNKPTLHAGMTSYTCAMPKCGKTFVNLHDLGRHKKTIHVDKRSGEGYRCASCIKSDKIWTRIDNFKKHLRDQHGILQVEEHVQKSTRAKRGVDTTVDFAVITPDNFSQKASASSVSHSSTL